MIVNTNKQSIDAQVDLHYYNENFSIRFRWLQNPNVLIVEI
jgi:hypothetical protein